MKDYIKEIQERLRKNNKEGTCSLERNGKQSVNDVIQIIYPVIAEAVHDRGVMFASDAAHLIYPPASEHRHDPVGSRYGINIPTIGALLQRAWGNSPFHTTKRVLEEFLRKYTGKKIAIECKFES